MDLNTLKVYYEVCKAENFTKASKFLYISQSAVSIQIKKLEDSLGVKLIERDSKNFKLTFAGKKVYKMAREIFNKINRTENHLKKIVNTKDKKIVIGATHNIAEPLLPHIIKAYMKKNKDVAFEINVKNGESLMNKLKDAELDIVLAENINIDDKDVRIIYTQNYPFVIAAPNFIKSYEDLKKISLLKRDITRTNYYIEKFEEITGFKNEKEMMVTGSLETIKNMIINGMGYSVLPYYSVYDKLSKKEFKIIHKFNDTDNKFQIIFMNDSFESEEIKKFIDYLIDDDITKPLKGL